MLYTRNTHNPFLVPMFPLSNKISVVPPTPPPLSESQCGGGPARVTCPSGAAGWGRGGTRRRRVREAEPRGRAIQPWLEGPEARREGGPP